MHYSLMKHRQLRSCHLLLGKQRIPLSFFQPVNMKNIKRMHYFTVKPWKGVLLKRCTTNIGSKIGLLVYQESFLKCKTWMYKWVVCENSGKVGNFAINHGEQCMNESFSQKIGIWRSTLKFSAPTAITSVDVFYFTFKMPVTWPLVFLQRFVINVDVSVKRSLLMMSKCSKNTLCQASC